ncbi:MAG: succinylglutamate desuccinylase/aspartoacylase family protein [Bacteroidetes bacterium]|nr:succinylglutamate desuccinylase/aspartoacylase family protein [Bacteroidota bacterium]
MSIRKAITILGTEIKPGKRTVLNMNIARLHTGTPVEIQVIVERAKKEGPCLLLTAGIHGDEINGVEIVRQIISKGYNKPECGTIICIPIVNIFGFINQARSLPDGRDLNRVFPGSPTGSLASRFAHALVTEIIPHIDYCIDYHTGGADRFNYTQIRVNSQDEDALKLAKVFGAKFILHAKDREKSFRETASAMNKTVLLFEGGKTLNLDRRVTSIGISGALRVMDYLGIRKLKPETKMSAGEAEMIVIEESVWVRAKVSGMYRSSVALGSYVKKGAVLGTVSNPYGDFEKKIQAPHEGYVICNNHAPIVNQGDAVVHLTKQVNKLV